jgi:hypothetical protein
LSNGYFAISRGFLFQLISAASSSFWALVTNAAVEVAGVDVAVAVEPGTGAVDDVR